MSARGWLDLVALDIEVLLDAPRRVTNCCIEMVITRFMLEFDLKEQGSSMYNDNNEVSSVAGKLCLRNADCRNAQPPRSSRPC